jgi:murein hydrolase activator
VKTGDTVDPGSPLGRAGDSRPTITVELRRNGVPVDVARVVS